MNKILTISIAAYNVEQYIEMCLNSFADEIFNDTLEVLIIDDGGTDSTRSKAELFAEKYPSVFKVIHKENGGWGSTLNYSFKNASGKYIKQLDGDDYFDHDNMLELISYLKQCDDDIVYTPFVLVDDKTGNTIRTVGYNNKFIEKQSYVLEEAINDVDLVMHMCTFKTDIMRKCELLEHCFYTDVEMVIKGFINASTISFLNTPIYFYRISRDGQSVSVSGFKKHCEEHLRVLNVCLSCMSEMKASNVKTAVINRLKGMTSEHFIACLCLDVCRENKRLLIAFDKGIKNNYPEVYQSDSKIVKLCRISRFILYPVLAARVQHG